jgi:hypothetical protein
MARKERAEARVAQRVLTLTTPARDLLSSVPQSRPGKQSHVTAANLSTRRKDGWWCWAAALPDCLDREPAALQMPTKDGEPRDLIGRCQAVRPNFRHFFGLHHDTASINEV